MKTIRYCSFLLLLTLALAACGAQQDGGVTGKYYPLALSLLMFSIAIPSYRSYKSSRKNRETVAALRKQLDDQKAQVEITMSQLHRINSDKDRILNVVAHDLRNPINAVLSLVNIMEDTGVTEEQKELLQMMTEASNGSLMLIGEILEFSGNALQAPGGRKEVAEVHDMLQRAITMMKFKADEKRQRLELYVFPKSLHVTTYPEKMTRVFSNLISNAIKFSPEHAVIHIDIIEKIRTVVIKFTDRGVGIPEANKPHVFQIFTTAKRMGTSGEASFGLGLSICKQIVEANDGKIWFDSTEGKGTSFFVELPLANPVYAEL